jgi:hypothetical protein
MQHFEKLLLIPILSLGLFSSAQADNASNLPKDCSWVIDVALPDIASREKGQDFYIYLATNGHWCQIGEGPSKEIAKNQCDINASNDNLSVECLPFVRIDSSGSYEIALKIHL